MEVPPRFGYSLTTEQTISGVHTWGSNSSFRLFYRFAPRYSLPMAGAAIYVYPALAGSIRALLYYSFETPYWSTSDNNVGLLTPTSDATFLMPEPFPDSTFSMPESYGRDEVSDLETTGGGGSDTSGTIVDISPLNFPLNQGSHQYALAIWHGNSGNVGFVYGPDPRACDTAWHPQSHYGVSFWNGSDYAWHYARFNMQIRYRMPDGTIKFFEPLWTSLTQDVYTNNGLRIRFSVPSGVNIRVDGVVLSHFTKQGSPGGLKARLWQGSTQLLETDPFPESWTPPSAANQMSFYMPFLGNALLSGGNTYDLEITVVGTNNATNRFAMKTLVIADSAIPDWWTYRVVVGSTEDWSKVPTVFLLTLDLNSPFS